MNLTDGNKKFTCMRKNYQKILLITQIFICWLGLSLNSYGQVAPIIRDIFIFSECEKSASIRVRGGVAPYTYVWTYNGNIIQVDANLGPTEFSTIERALPGDYYLEVTDSNGTVYTEVTTFKGSTSFTVNVFYEDVQSCGGGTTATVYGTIVNGIPRFTVNFYDESGNRVRTYNTRDREINLSNVPAGKYLVEVIDASGCKEYTEIEIEEVDPIVLPPAPDVTTFPETCESNGGIALDLIDFEGQVEFRIRRRRGNRNYVTDWIIAPDGKIRYDQLPAGDYVLEIKDRYRGDCPAEIVFTIGRENLLDFRATATPISCVGDTNGTITLDVNRLVSNFAFPPNEVRVDLIGPNGNTIVSNFVIPVGANSGTHTFTGLPAGNYTIIVKHGGVNYPECSQTIRVTVAAPQPFNANVSVTQITCFGENNGSATVNPSGGWGNYTYLWSTGATTRTVNNLAPGNYSVTVTDREGCAIVLNFTITAPEAPLNGQIELLRGLTCVGANDGSARVFNLSGGLGTYTIRWSNGETTATATRLPAGLNTVTVRDNGGCEETFEIFVPVPPAPDVTTSVTNPLCYGGADGSIRVQIADNTTSYSVTVNGQTRTGNDLTFNNLPAGQYTVQVTYGGVCSITEIVNISNPPRININDNNVVITNVQCYGDNNGSITGLRVNGGTGTLSYQWQQLIGGVFTNIPGQTSLNINNLSAGTYKIIITDNNNCPVEREFTITSPDEFLVSTPMVTGVACFGDQTGSVAFTISGGTLPYAYSFNGGPFITTYDTNVLIDGLTNGAGYTVEIRDANNCAGTNFTFDINSLPEIIISDAIITPETCFEQGNASISISTSGGSGNLGIEWYRAGDLTNILSTNPTLSNVGPGEYTVKVFNVGTSDDCYVLRNFTIPPTAELTLELNGSPVDVLCHGEETGAISVLVQGGTGNHTFQWTGPNGFTSTAQNLQNVAAGSYTVRVTDENGCWKELDDIIISQPTSAILISTLNKVEPNCFDSTDGRINIQVAGGTPSYTIRWEKDNGSGVFSPIPGSSQSLTNIGAGTYKVIVTDANNCISEEIIELNAPEQLQVSILSVENVSCTGRNDGKIFIEVTGGTGVYFFNWDHGFINQNPRNLSEGTYGVTVRDSNGCTVRIEDIIIGGADDLSITLVNIEEPSCTENNGSIEVSFSGAIPSQEQIRWINLQTNEIIATNTNIVTGLGAGFYRVEYSNNGSCLVSEIYRVPGPAAPLKLSVNSQDVTCAGSDGLIFLSATGGTPGYTYYILHNGDWEVVNSLFLSNLDAGTYDVKVRDAGGCEDFSTIIINQQNPPAYEINVEQNVSCYGLNDGIINFELYGDTSNLTFQWFKKENTGDVAIATSSLNNLFAGTYYLEITFADGCKLTSDDYIITEPDQITVNPTVIQPVCYDDLGSFTLTVSGGEFGKTITLRSASNGIIATYENENEGTFTFEDLAPGTYTWEVGDTGCSDLDGTFTITVPLKPEFTVSKIDISCFGSNDGVINILGPTVQPGRTFTVFLNGVAQGNQTALNNLAAGNYEVRIADDQGCLSDPVLVSILTSDRPLEIFNLVKTDAACYNENSGSVQFEILGGSPVYRVEISSLNGYSSTLSNLDGSTSYSFNNLPAGSYTLQVWDLNDNCDASATFEITQPQELFVNHTQGTVLCEGGTTFIELTVTGGTQPYTYTWERFNTATSTWETLPTTTRRLNNITAGTYRYTVTELNNCTSNSDEIVIADGVPVQLTYVANDITCFGGSARVTLTATSGTSTNFTYFVNGNQIFGNQFQAIAGTYTAYAIDNVKGCISDEITITVNQPSNPVQISHYSFQDLSCFEAGDGIISLALTGGTAPYTITFQGNSYSANDGEIIVFDNLSANINYTFTAVDANGCTVNIPPRILSQPLPLQASHSFTPIACYDGESEINLQITGGTRPYQVTWEYAIDNVNFSSLPQFDNETSISNLEAGYYRYTISDGGCNAVVQTVEITQPDPVLLDAVTTDISCFGGMDGTVTFTPSGGPSTIYRIFFNGVEMSGNTVTGLSAGTYTAFVLSGACRSENIQVVIEQPEEPLQVRMTYLEEALCVGGTSEITLEISGGNGNYNAVLNGTNYPVDNSGFITISDVLPGTHIIEVFDSEGCSWIQTITITNPTVIDIFHHDITHVTCIGGSDGEISINVTGGAGEYTFTWFNSQNQPIGNTKDITGLSAGTYTVVVTDENGCEISEQFQINDPEPLDFTIIEIVHISCFGLENGSITVQGMGGTPEYFLIIDDVQYPGLTVSGLKAGTYTVAIVDSNGCASDEKQVIINEPQPLALSIDSVNINCYGANNGQALLNITGGTAPYSVRWSDGNILATRNSLVPGIYEVIVTDANGCSVRDNVVITQPEPVVITETITNVNCYGGNDGSITLDVNGETENYQITWKNKVTSANVGTGATASNLSAGVYIAEILDENGCKWTREYMVIQPSEPLFAQAFQTNIRCAGEDNGTINLIVAGGTAPYTYQWSNGETTRSIFNLSQGIYEVTITDANGCIITESYEITEPEPLTVTVDSLQDVSCKFGNDGSIRLNIEGGAGNYRITWSNGRTGPELTNLRAGEYTVFIIDDNSCFYTETFTISEPTDILSIEGISTTQLCNADDQIELLLTVIGGTAPYSYQWSNGSTDQNLTGILPGNYSVVVTDANGCEVSGNFNVPPATSPLQVEFGGRIDLCSPNERGEVRATVIGGAAPFTYLWSNGATTPTISNLTPGEYSVFVTDANGCTVEDSVVVTTPGNWRINLDAIQSVSCFGGNNGSIQISVIEGRGPFKITWSHGVEDQLFVGNLTPGNYSVRVEDEAGCAITATYNIREPELLTFTDMVENVTCAGENNGSISINVAGGTPPYSYQWSNGSNSRNLRNLKPGDYTLVITDRNGCSTGATYTITEPQPLAIESEFSENLLCNGDTEGFININITGGIQPYKVSWSDEPENENLNRFNLTKGVYKITVIDDNGCQTEQTFEIKEPELLEISLNTAFDVDCENRDLKGVAWVDIKGGSGDYIISWNTGQQNTNEIIFMEDGDLMVTVIDKNGCTAEAITSVTMPVAFTDADFTYTIISLGTEGQILVNDPVQFLDKTEGNVIAWEWDFGDGNKSNEQNPQHTYTKPGTYTITLMTFDALGCVSTASIEVEVLASHLIMVPNAFTPNGDGLNDTFFPKMRGIVGLEMHVFNKWGELVYSSYSVEDKGWDGTLRGVLSPNGNYVYKIVYQAIDGETGTMTGVFTLFH